MTRRALARREAAEHVERTALRLFIDRGYDATTIDDIAAASGVSRASFFRYFGSKEGVIFAAEARHRGRLMAALRARPAARSDCHVLAAALMEFFGSIEPEREAFQLRATVTAQNPGLVARALLLREQWAEEIARELSCRADPQPNDRVLAAAVARALWHALYRFAQGADMEELRHDLPRALDSSDWPAVSKTAHPTRLSTT